MNKKYLIMVVLAGILWGTSGLFVDAWGAYGASPMQIVSYRIVTAAIMIWIYALIFDRKAIELRVKDLAFYLPTGVTLLTSAAFYYSAIKESSVSTAVILMYTAPILVMGYSVLFFGEKFNAKKGISVAAMLIGCAFVSGIVGGMEFKALGVILGLSASVSYATYNVLTKYEMSRGCNPITTTLYGFLFAAIFTLIVNPVGPMIDILAQAPVKTIPLAFAHGLMTFVLPYFLYTLSMRRIPAGVASSLAIIEPMSATIFSVVFLGEKLSIYGIVGIVMILGSVFMLSREEA